MTISRIKLKGHKSPILGKLVSIVLQQILGNNRTRHNSLSATEAVILPAPRPLNHPQRKTAPTGRRSVTLRF